MRGNRMAASVPCFVAFEVRRTLGMSIWSLLLTASWNASFIAMMRVVTVVDGTVKIVRPVKPRTGSDEDAANKPLGAVITVGSATIRLVVKIAIRTNGSGSDAYTDSDLRLGFGSSDCQTKNRKDGNRNIFELVHGSSPVYSESKVVTFRVGDINGIAAQPSVSPRFFCSPVCAAGRA